MAQIQETQFHGFNLLEIPNHHDEYRVEWVSGAKGKALSQEEAMRCALFCYTKPRNMIKREMEKERVFFDLFQKFRHQRHISCYELYETFTYLFGLCTMSLERNDKVQMEDGLLDTVHSAIIQHFMNFFLNTPEGGSTIIDNLYNGQEIDVHISIYQYFLNPSPDKNINIRTFISLFIENFRSDTLLNILTDYVDKVQEISLKSTLLYFLGHIFHGHGNAKRGDILCENAAEMGNVMAQYMLYLKIVKLIPQDPTKIADALKQLEKGAQMSFAPALEHTGGLYALLEDTERALNHLNHAHRMGYKTATLYLSKYLSELDEKNHILSLYYNRKATSELSPNAIRPHMSPLDRFK